MGENETVSSISVLIVMSFWGDRFMGVLEVTSRFRFREGTASSMSVDCGESSIFFEVLLLWANLERDVRVDRLVEVLEVVALINLVVSWDIRDVRIVKMLSLSCNAGEVSSWVQSSSSSCSGIELDTPELVSTRSRYDYAGSLIANLP